MDSSIRYVYIYDLTSDLGFQIFDLGLKLDLPHWAGAV